MTFRHLKIFLTVCETMNMTKAAGELHISQPSITQAIQVAWAFTQMGCTLEGMIEIYGSGRKFMSNEYEKVPAFLFSL